MGNETIYIIKICIDDGILLPFVDKTGIVFHTSYKEIAIMQAKHEAQTRDRSVVIIPTKPFQVEPEVQFDAIRVYPNNDEFEYGIIGGQKI